MHVLTLQLLMLESMLQLFIILQYCCKDCCRCMHAVFTTVLHACTDAASDLLIYVEFSLSSCLAIAW